MKVLVYVEGPSDRIALEALLKSVVTQGRDRGVGISFPALNGKDPVLKDAPRKAADHLADNPMDWVFALPDLYPMAKYDNTEQAHRSFVELKSYLKKSFEIRAQKRNLSTDTRDRFRVHCLKHDLEALLLADPAALKQRLKTTDHLDDAWRHPVEDQNDQQPPKRIVEGLFDKYRKRRKYSDTSDAPWILQRASLERVLAACPQQFAPFVAELQALAETGSLPLRS